MITTTNTNHKITINYFNSLVFESLEQKIATNNVHLLGGYSSHCVMMIQLGGIVSEVSEE
jgi:hypothetical protein